MPSCRARLIRFIVNHSIGPRFHKAGLSMPGMRRRMGSVYCRLAASPKPRSTAAPGSNPAAI